MNREAVSTKTLATLQAAATISATGGSRYVDLQDVDAMSLLIAVGDLGSPDGSNNLVITFAEADDTPAAAGSYTAVAAADLRGDVNASGEVVIDATDAESRAYLVGYVGSKRYLRAIWTETGTISGPLSVTAIGEYAAREAARTEVTLATGAVT